MTNKIISGIAAFALIAAIVLPGVSSAAGPNWDVSGTYDISLEYQGSDYVHDMALTQDDDGDLSGSGGYPAGGAHTYAWTITSGSVSGDNIVFTANYTAGVDAVNPLTTLVASGTIASDGTMSGTWSDNYQGGTRSGTWETTAGTADPFGSLHAEDFGVVNYDTGEGILKGYTAGFGLDDADFEDAESVVVKLYAAGDQLLQTNMLIGDVSGDQISSPFDVSGNFDYEDDGYWTNVRESQYGQSVPAVKVVATVTLENGQVLTATNTNLTGDPTTIYLEVTTPSNKDQCKNGGWKNFTNPSFKNQGQCISSMNR